MSARRWVLTLAVCAAVGFTLGALSMATAPTPAFATGAQGPELARLTPRCLP